MAEYIERSVGASVLRAKANMAVLMDAAPYFEKAAQILEKLPAADVAPVVHGKWEHIGIVKKIGPIYPRCSACGIVSAAYRSQWEGLQGPWKYCPVCGAKMDGEP